MKTLPYSKLLLLIIFSVSVISCKSPSTIPDEGFVPINENLRLHYNIVGEGSDTVVVPTGAWVYPYAKKFNKHLTCILYDVRDRGYSDSMANHDLIGMDFEIEDLEAVRKFFKIDKMNVVGWSYVGGVAALYAIKYPERTKSVVQVGPIPLRKGQHWDAYLQSVTQRRDSVLDHDLKNMEVNGINKTDPQLYCKKFYEALLAAIIADKKQATRFVEQVPCNCENEWPQNLSVRYIIMHLKDWDWSDKIKSLKAPTLIIHGVGDNIPVGSSEEWASLNDDSKLLIFQSSGHMPFAEEPELFFQSITDFVSAK